jgi:hypothetical protein
MLDETAGDGRRGDVLAGRDGADGGDQVDGEELSAGSRQVASMPSMPSMPGIRTSIRTQGPRQSR